MAHIAIEGRCFVLAACQYSQEKDYPPEHPVADSQYRNPENVMIGGGSVIINPMGEVLAGPLLEGEGILTADIDVDDTIRGKFDLDVVGHYARNDGRCHAHRHGALEAHVYWNQFSSSSSWGTSKIATYDCKSSMMYAIKVKYARGGQTVAGSCQWQPLSQLPVACQ